jgi:hypothetical protein
MNPGTIFAALVVSIIFGAAAFKARRARKHGWANVYGYTGIAGYITATVGMF